MEKLVISILKNTFFLSLLVGIIFLVTSLIMLRFLPKKINYLYGYRTTASMKNQKTWDFSQRYSCFAMMKVSFGLIILSFTNFFFKFDDTMQMPISIGLTVCSAIYIFYTTEKAIKKNFPNKK